MKEYPHVCAGQTLWLVSWRCNMPGQRSKDKKALQVWLDKRLIAQIETEAQRLDQTKTDVVVRALRYYFKLDPIPASAAQLDEIRVALAALKQGQSETMKLIQEQPPVQAPALPEPEPEKRGFWSRLFG